MHSTQHYGAEPAPNTRGDPEVTIADGEAGPPDERAPFERGETIGRYVVLETLGQGGMGIVVAAYDAKLDRRVALKVLRQHASSDPENHARMLREAQSLAKLSHPGVVSVYDVGELRGRIFIAMEFIDGPNLRRWSHEQTRTPQEIIAVFRDAARGLQAAHDAGIVHRDFKPDNVLIGSDGRARVTDFGLALKADVEVEASLSDSVSTSGRLTETGMVMGTPAYMPIEQHVGHITDARSDQFSFCVSFYEALYGVRPFVGNTANEYCLSIRRAEIPPPPSGISVPRRVHRAILKGLSAKPDDRHPSMRVLRRAITPRARSKRTWVLGGLGGLAIGASVVAVVDSPSRPCSSFDERVAEVYDGEDKRRILAAFTNTELPYSQDAFDATSDALDDFGQRWTEAARSACLASERGEQSDRMLDLRMHCLDRARSRLSATVQVLRVADAAVVREGVALAQSQAELSLCGNLEVLERTSILPADADEVEESNALFEVLDRVEALRAAGRKEDAKMLYAEHETRLESSTYPPIQGLALWTRGRIKGTDNDADGAILLFEQAHLLALEHGLDSLAATAASSLAFYYTEFRADYEQAEHYLDIGGALARASGSRRVQAAVAGNVMTLRFRQARFDEAVAAALLEVEFARQGNPSSDLEIGEALLSYAHAIRLRDGPKAALPPLEDARDHILETLGTTHPILVRTYAEQAAIARELGDNDAAFVHGTAALDQARTAFGEDSLDVAYERANLATIVGNLGRKREALEMFAAVDERFIVDMGRDHVVRAAVLNNMAAIHTDYDEWPDAERYFLEALRIAQVVADGPSNMVVTLRRNLALVNIYQEEFADARTHAEASLKEGHAVYGEDHMESAITYSVLGRIQMAEDDYGAARASLERAVEIGHDRDTERAAFEFHLAEALVEDPDATDEDRRRGMRLARKAEKVFAVGSDVGGTHKEVLEWLAEHEQGFSPG